MKIAVDSVIFSYFEKRLNVLLIERTFQPFVNHLALPGGFLLENENASQAVKRKVKEETNLEIDYLEQLYTFTDVNRDPRERIISISYYGLIPAIKYNFKTNVHASEINWHSIDDIMSKNLAFDHKEIILYALERLKNKIKYEPIGFDLLPQYFSMGELWELYSSIMNSEPDRRNFTRKILKYNLLKQAPFKNTGYVGRKAQLYEFDKQRYDELKKEGFNLDI